MFSAISYAYLVVITVTIQFITQTRTLVSIQGNCMDKCTGTSGINQDCLRNSSVIMPAYVCFTNLFLMDILENYFLC